MEIQRNELLRYLGWKGQEVDENLQNKLEEAAKRCLELARPRCVVKKFQIGADMRIAENFALEGKDVAAHLAGCKELYLFAATVGADAEREISRLFAAGKANDALLLDSAATCAAESYADEICEDLQAGEKYALTERFSCGYGDFPLSAQPKILRLLSADTKIGLCADDSFLLAPQKSVTALIGVTDKLAPAQKKRCHNKCGGCKHGGCAYRKE